ncbi:MAG: hypothetical protein ACE5HP_05840 [Gemmatimonadota bacterium]
MKRYLTAAGLVALGVALGLAGRRLAGPGGEDRLLEELAKREGFQRQQVALAEERCKKNAEYTLVQTYRLTEFRRFAQLGQEVAAVLVASSSASASGGTRIPRVVLDADARQQWAGLTRFLDGLEGGVDDRVFEAYRAVRDFAAAHPWPARTSLAAIARSGWSRTVLDRWTALNRTLSSRVTGALGAFYTGA